MYVGSFNIPKVNLSEIVDNNGVITNFAAVSDKVLTVGAVVDDLSAVKEDWGFDQSELYSMVNSSNSFVNCNQDVYSYVTYDKFGSAGQQDKVTNKTIEQDGVRVASIEEMSYLVDKRAKASDLVCFLLGKNSNNTVNYWTRNLGSSLDNGQIITSAGTEKSNWLNRQNGVRFAMTMTVGGGV